MWVVVKIMLGLMAGVFLVTTGFIINVDTGFLSLASVGCGMSLSKALSEID